MRDRGRALLVASGRPELVAHAREVILAGAGRELDLVFLVSPRPRVLRQYLDALQAVSVVHASGLLAALRTITTLRRMRFARVYLLLGDVRRFRALMAIGALAGFPDLWCIDTELRCFALDLPAAAGEVRRRFRSRVRRGCHLFCSALRLAWTRGLVAALHRQRVRAESSAWRGRLWTRGSPLSTSHEGLAVSEGTANPSISTVVFCDDGGHRAADVLEALRLESRVEPLDLLLVRRKGSVARIDPAVLKRLAQFPVLEVPEKASLGEAANRAVSSCTGEVILVVDPVGVLLPGSVRAARAVFASIGDCGVVGGMVLGAGGALVEAGRILWREGCVSPVGELDSPRRPEHDYLRRVDLPTPEAYILRRRAWERAVGFDSSYRTWEWASADLCFRLRREGFSTWYQPRFVLDSAARSARDRRATGATARSEDEGDRERFRRTWRAELAGQPGLDMVRMFLARDRNPGRTVLVFDQWVPAWDRDAGSRFMFELLKALVTLQYRVVLWPHDRVRAAPYAEALQQSGIEVIYGPLTIDEFLATTKVFIDVTIAYRAHVAEEYLPRFEGSRTSRGYIAVDLAHVREARRRCAAGLPHPGTVDALERRERQVVSMADCVAVHSGPERRILEQELGARTVCEMPLLVAEADPGSDDLGTRRGLLFIGSAHPPNVDAAEHFVRRVLPRIHAEMGPLPFWIVGEVCDRLRGMPSSAGVFLVGPVKDLDPWFHRARVFVAPVRYGAGIKGKILDALRYGLPLVTTPVGAEGLHLEHGATAMIADDDAELAKAVLALHSQPRLWRDLRQRGLLLAQELGDRPQFLARARAFMAALEDAHPEARHVP